MSENKSAFEEITLAITILTGLSFFLFKIADYFNNNIVRYSPDLQNMIYFLVIGLLIEMTIISSFLILKGYAISIGEIENSSIYGINWLFNLLFKGLIGLSVFSFALLLVIVLNNLYKNITIPIINYNIRMQAPLQASRTRQVDSGARLDSRPDRGSPLRSPISGP